MQIIEAPTSLKCFVGSTSIKVFVAGSIEMGKARDWQTELIEKLNKQPNLKKIDIVLFNPRRSDWDSSWKEDINNPQFREQVEWELEAQKMANIIPMHFEAESKAPITLMEFGLNILFRCAMIQVDGWNFFPRFPSRLIVHCPKGFWKKGNVDIVCVRYNIEQVKTLDDLISKTIEFIQFVDKQKKLLNKQRKS